MIESFWKGTITTLIDWRRTPRTPHLADGDAHVWRIAIGPGVLAQPYWSVLCPDERARALRFLDDAHRAAYVRAHGAMRMILAGYVSSTPEALRFQHGTFGKPSLAPDGNVGPLQFNLSDAGDLALLAVARNRAVGIDIARQDALADHAGIAERFFSLLERRSLRSSAGTPERTRDAFYSAWTRKEAYVKATGRGLSRGLDHFDVSMAQGEPPALNADRLDVDAPSRWTMIDLKAQDGYSAALVVAKPVGDVALFNAPAFETMPWMSRSEPASRQAPQASAIPNNTSTM